MVKIRTRPMERIFLNMAVRLGVAPADDHPAPTVRSAIYMARVEMREYIDGVIGNDLSPAAQKIRAAMRKM